MELCNAAAADHAICYILFILPYVCAICNWCDIFFYLVTACDAALSLSVLI